MATPLTGGCLCGAVRYECSAEPVMTGNCILRAAQCRHHRRSRGFCPTCSSRLFGKPAIMPEVMSIMAGSLDDPSSHKPAMDIYTASVQPSRVHRPTWRVASGDRPHAQ
jgi:hypothetical protein